MLNQSLHGFSRSRANNQMPVLHFDSYYGPPNLSQASSAAKLPVKRMNKTDRKVINKGRMTSSNATLVTGLESRREFLPHIKEFKQRNDGSRGSYLKRTASKSPRSVPPLEEQIEVVPEEQNISESEDIQVNQEDQNEHVQSSTEAKRNNDISIQIDALQTKQSKRSTPNEERSAAANEDSLMIQAINNNSNYLNGQIIMVLGSSQQHSSTHAEDNNSKKGTAEKQVDTFNTAAFQPAGELSKPSIVTTFDTAKKSIYTNKTSEHTENSQQVAVSVAKVSQAHPNLSKISEDNTKPNS